MKISVVDILTLSSLVVAFITWFLTYLKSTRDSKIANTVNLINNLSTVAHLNAADLLVRKLIGEPKKPPTFGSKNEEALIIVLDYYEFLTQLYARSLIHRESFNHLRGNLVTKTFTAAKAYINEKRNSSSRTDLYSKLEAYCDAYQRL